MDAKTQPQDQNQGGQLKRTLKGRHLTMIALGGSIGTALFLATGFTVNKGGPGGAIVAYCVVAIMVYFLITSLGEMATWLPCSGSFQTYASRFVNPAFGFAIGWNYWFNWAVVIGIEIIAACIFMRFWFPTVPMWIFAVIFCMIILAINLFSAKIYGETEYWFASIKVVATIVFLIVGVGIMTGLLGNQGAVGFSNFTESPGGIFPHGISGVIACSFTAVFCFLGCELVGIAAGEGERPEETIPKAVKTIFLRVVIFYIGATFFVAALIPWQEAGVEGSPFTFIFNQAGIKAAANIMNFVVVTSTLSCANSGLYASSRTLFSMAKEGKAPKIFARVSKQNVPVPALILTALMGSGAFLSKFMGAEQVYIVLVAASSLATIFSWIGIASAHLRFRKWYLAQGNSVNDLKFKAKFYPVGPIFAIIMCVIVIIGMFFSKDTLFSAIAGCTIFFAALGIGIYKNQRGELPNPTIEELRAQSQG